MLKCVSILVIWNVKLEVQLFTFFLILLFRQNNAQRIYLTINFNIVSTATCFDASVSSSDSLIFYLLKLQKKTLNLKNQ
jgi:hypothetical protein